MTDLKPGDRVRITLNSQEGTPTLEGTVQRVEPTFAEGDYLTIELPGEPLALLSVVTDDSTISLVKVGPTGREIFDALPVGGKFRMPLGHYPDREYLKVSREAYIAVDADAGLPTVYRAHTWDGWVVEEVS